MSDYVKNAVNKAKEKSLAEGMGKNKGDKPGAGPGGNCICASCGHKEKHLIDEPCNQKKCPKCGTMMTRE